MAQGEPGSRSGVGGPAHALVPGAALTRNPLLANLAAMRSKVALPGRTPPISRRPSGAMTDWRAGASTLAAALVLRATRTLVTTPCEVRAGSLSL